MMAAIPGDAGDAAHTDMTGADPVEPPYYVAGNDLMVGGEVLLSGPLLRIEQICDVLNASLPADDALPEAIRALISMTKGEAFRPGARLQAIGRLRLRQRAPVKAPRRGRPRSGVQK